MANQQIRLDMRYDTVLGGTDVESQQMAVQFSWPWSQAPCPGSTEAAKLLDEASDRCWEDPCLALVGIEAQAASMHGMLSAVENKRT